MPIPEDRCQRCTGLLNGVAFLVDGRDRACADCAETARRRGDDVEPLELADD